MNAKEVVGPFVLVWFWSYAGCVTPQSGDEAARQKMLELIMPRKIAIVKPFTRVRNFEDSGSSEGIELLVQASNSLDNPGLMIVGGIRVELYEFVAGSGDQKGRQLEQWDIDLSTEKQQRTYWNTLTQMYEFRLGIDPTSIPPAERYVLMITYNSPLGEHLTDDCVIEYCKTAGPLGGVRVRSP